MSHHQKEKTVLQQPSLVSKLLAAKEDQDVGGRIILGWILERWDGVMLTGLVWLRIRTGGELL
jgi:hypothetical protein